MKLQNVKILTDENISPKVVRFFREQGVNVVDVKEEGAGMEPKMTFYWRLHTSNSE